MMDTNNARQRVVARYMEAGIFEPPPRLFETVRDWMFKTFAAHALARAEGICRQYIKDLAQFSADVYAKKRFVDAVSLKRAASKYASKGRLIKTSAKTTIEVDVRGWKYLRPDEEANAASVMASRLPEITCILFFDSHANRGGQWHLGKRTLQVDTRSAMVDNVSGFEYALSEIDRVTYHETQHVGQDALRMIRGLKEDAGLPPTSIRVPETPDQKSRPEHALRDVEFYTDLQNEIRHFRNKLRLIPAPDWRAAARIFMDDPKGADMRTQDPKVLALLRSEYFQTLHKKAPDKWRKAVTEFAKAIEPYLGAGE